MTAATLPVKEWGFSADTTEGKWFHGDLVILPLRERMMADSSEIVSSQRPARLHIRRRRLSPEELENAYRAAAADPHFVTDMADVTQAFDPTVGDGLERE